MISTKRRDDDFDAPLPKGELASMDLVCLKTELSGTFVAKGDPIPTDLLDLPRVHRDTFLPLEDAKATTKS